MITAREEELEVISLLVSGLRLIVAVDVVKNKKPSMIPLKSEPSKNSIRLLRQLLAVSDSVNGRLLCPIDFCIPCKCRKTLHKRISTVAIQP